MAVALLLAAGGGAGLHAAEAGKPPRLNPDGIDGALLVCGDHIPDAALDRFVDLAGGGTAALAVVCGAGEDREAAKKLAESLKARKPASVVVVQEGEKDPDAVKSVRDAAGVWLPAGTTRGPLTGVGKHSVIAVSGAAAGDALGLLPGAMIEPDFRPGDVDKLFTALDKAPGSFGVGLGPDAALLVQGRRMHIVGAGSVIVGLAKSEARLRRTIELNEKNPCDYTMLRRAALARAGAPFPPKERTVPEVPNGALVIVGGGGMPADVTKKFIELAGGPDARIVVLPTANPGATGDEGGFFKRVGAKNVVSLPAVKLDEVEDPKNLDELRKADAVWFGGGRQWHFVDAYEGTKACDLFRDVLRRGGVIGGSSAGATIQGDYLCRGSPLNNTDEMCEGYERGFAFLPGVAIDQHFTQRNRFADMTGLMKAYPQLLGIGLDEATAIVVRGHEADVMGKGEAHFYDGRPAADGKPDYDALKAGGRYDLKARKLLATGP